MGIGENIYKYRKLREYTQEELAEELDVTFQAVSSWERNEYAPDIKKLPKLIKVLKVPYSFILEDKTATYSTKDAIYNWEHMKTYVKTVAKTQGMDNTLKAVDFAVEAHGIKTRKNTDVLYISHPLTMACHALAMGIKEDEIIAGILLHDVIEDCEKEPGIKYSLEDLPVNDETKELVRLMTKDKTPGGNKEEKKEKYYEALATNPKAALIKCIDRCNNMTTMSWGLTPEGIYNYIIDGDKYYPRLLKVVKNTPEYNDAAWLLQYQIESMLDIYKRLM